jgi:hypothetical protein
MDKRAETIEAKELESLNNTTWEDLNPDWLEDGDLTSRFAKSQFDNCPGCGNFEQLKVYNTSHDEQGASVLCLPCGWQANGETPSEAIQNWNTRAVHLSQSRDAWTRWDWDDPSTHPQTDHGWFLCHSGVPDDSPVVDEWDGSEFIHYGYYAYWMPVAEQPDKEQK